MRVLFTNAALSTRAGTEMYIHDVALELLHRGHTPLVYSPELGEVAESLRNAIVPVTDDISRIGEPPDIIHGHHHLELMTALARFPDTPAVTVCHGWRPWEEMPLTAAQVRRFIGVDEATRDRLVFEHGVPADRIRIIPNFVDFSRFPPRGPLPPIPARVLLFSNYATPVSPYCTVAEAACARAGLALDKVGVQFGNVTANPAALLAQYDIVLAQGRSAIEAIGVGAMVIVCSSRQFGPPVLMRNVERLRTLNFGVRAQTLPVSVETLCEHLHAYHPEDAAQVSAYIRREAPLGRAVDQLLDVYREAIDDFRGAPYVEENRRSKLPAYFRNLGAMVRRSRSMEFENFTLQESCRSKDAQIAALRHEQETLLRSLTWRGREWILRLPGIRRIRPPLERWMLRRRSAQSGKTAT